MNIGERIRNTREAQGMSQDDLAKKLGYKTRSTIAKIETGKNKVTTENAVKISQALNVPLSNIMGWDVDCSSQAYIDSETQEIAEQIYENKDLRILFNIAKDTSPERLKLYAEFLKNMSDNNTGE